MSVLVYIESKDGEIKKSSQEILSYAKSLEMGEVTAIHFGESNGIDSAGVYGANKVLNINTPKPDGLYVSLYTDIIYHTIEKNGINLLLVPKSPFIDVVAGRVAVKCNAAMISNVVGLPDVSSGFSIKRSIYTGKAFETISISADVKILSIRKNTVPIVSDGDLAAVEEVSAESFGVEPTEQLGEQIKQSGGISLTEADIVVSAGRGLKGAENWGMIEELAEILEAATGCSKPVSDMDWRPHHEHVGQTGIKVSPSLYIAVGISGAIQHLAGVNSSKNILVINKDPEAPFFKAADYGIIGDAFEVIPRLIEKLKEKQ